MDLVLEYDSAINIDLSSDPITDGPQLQQLPWVEGHANWA